MLSRQMDNAGEARHNAYDRTLVSAWQPLGVKREPSYRISTELSNLAS